MSNQRLEALKGSAAATARSLIRNPRIKVITTGVVPHWNHTRNELHVPAIEVSEDDDPRLVDAYRGVIDHECAHVVHTDMALVDAFMAYQRELRGEDTQRRIFALWNALEDGRIEATWAIRNPGSARHLEAMNSYVIEVTGGARVCDENAIAGGQPVGPITALQQAIVRVGSGEVRLEDCSELVQQLYRFVEPEIEAGVNASDTQGVLDATEALWAKLEQASEEPPPPEEQDGEGEPQDGDQEPQDGDQEPQDGEGEAGEGEPQDGDQEPQDGDQEPQDGEGKAGEGEGPGSKAKAAGPQPIQIGGDDTSGGFTDHDGSANDWDEGPVGGEAPDGGDSAGPSAPGQNDGSMAGDGGPATVQEAAAAFIEGELGKVPTAAEVIAGKFLSNPERRPYTVNPEARRQDTWETFDANQRAVGRRTLHALKAAAGPAIGTLSTLMRQVIQSTQETMWVGGLEEGSMLDDDALPYLAMGIPNDAIYCEQFNQRHESTAVVTLVDSSGSMGQNQPTKWCARHNDKASKSATMECQRRNHDQTRCGLPLQWRVTSKSGYAAIMAQALHEVFRLCNVPHAVLGHTTGVGATCDCSAGWREDCEASCAARNKIMPGDYPEWSRLRRSLVMSEYVPFPGIGDDGSAIPYINGRGCNLDAEAIESAAQYLAEKAPDASRLILKVVSDGLPAGADDTKLQGVHLQRTVERVARAGIEVYGIGIGVEKAAYERYYPDVSARPGRAATGCVILPNGRGLAREAMLELTQLIGASVGFDRRSLER